MTVYLFDEKRWLEEDPDSYANAMKNVISDLIVLVYGSWKGGAVGWKSKYIASMEGVSNTRLLDLISAMNKRGIRVHAAFNTCRYDRKSHFKPHRKKSKFVDVHDPMFQLFINNFIAECASLPINGVCLDYCRTDDFRDIKKNDESIERIVKDTYKEVKDVNPECIISSTTTPYLDLKHPELIKTGRKAINWANNGYQDILFDMNYGNRKGVHGDPPDMEVTYKARKLTETPIIIMVSSYKKNDKGEPVPTDAMKFSEVLDTVFNEDSIAIYTGWLFTDMHAVLLKQVYE